MFRRGLQVGLLAAALTASAAAQSSLTGRVVALDDGVRAPAKGAWVVASSGTPARIVASAAVDAEGTFLLYGLPEGRVEFTVSQSGYSTVEAGGATLAVLARTCPATGSCGEADFVTAPASVVEGYVTDPFGEPLVDVEVTMTQVGEAAATEQPQRGPLRRFALSQAAQTTDDRGYFRIHDVAAGDYELELRGSPFMQGLFSAEAQAVSVELGGSPSPLYIAMSVAAEPVQIGGVIQGLNLAEGEFVRMIAVNANGAPQRPMSLIRADSQSDGTPQLSGEMAPGDYILMAQVVSRDGGRRGPGGGRVVTLGRYRIDRDMTDLSLTASQGASFSGRIRFEGMEPRPVNLSLTPLDGGTPDFLRLGAGGRFQGQRGGGRRDNSQFERSALLPGRYKLEVNSSEYFLEGEKEFLLTDGATTQADIVVSGAFAEIQGVVRPPQTDASSAGPFLVALKDAAGKVVSIQTDEAGQYHFAKLLPGDYQICAWADVSVNPKEERSWTAAGDAVKRFPAAAGDQTEILLTAKP